MLRIVKATDPITVDRINLCIYSQPGLGKTTLGYSAESPLLLDFDNGATRAANRKDTVQVSTWGDVTSVKLDDLTGYRTVVIDTAGRALDLLSQDIIARNPKMGRAGALTLQGFGQLKAEFAAWLKMLRSFGKDVVLIAHMDEQRNGDEIIERLDVQGGSKGEIYKSVDAMGRIFIRDKKRVIDFSPRENSFGKNPANLDILEIPDPTHNGHFLADVIQNIKDSMNRLSEEQKAAQEQASEWFTVINDFSDAEDFNRNLAQVKKTSVAIQSYFAKKAKDMGFTYNKKDNLYEAQRVSA